MNSFSALPVHNVDDEHWDSERIAKLNYPSLTGDHWNVVKGDQIIECCHNCPIECGFNVYRVTAGPYAGLSMLAQHANLAFLGTRCGIDESDRHCQNFQTVELAGAGQLLYGRLHRGFSRRDDMTPPIFMQEPIKSGRFRGELLAPQDWDREISWQTQQILTELDLTDVLEKFAAHCKTPM